MHEHRAGKYVKQLNGYRAFIPTPLPPEPPVVLDTDLQMLLSQADRALARLDGSSYLLPNPDLFVAMYVKKEALLSSQIEGTQASLESVLEFEADLTPRDDFKDVKEVVNYIKAMAYGMKRLETFPMSVRLIKEIHGVLLEGTRGTERNPGEFRRSQNWIGPGGAPLREAFFVPPPHDMVDDLMGNLETLMHSGEGAFNIPALVKIALLHAQFEIIHPFLDGNGRMGRLLITLFLYWKGILEKPLLYLSFYLKKYREIYYQRLMDIRLKGDWESWVRFFLGGVVEVSEEAVSTARAIVLLKEKLMKTLLSQRVGGTSAIKLLELLFEKPLLSAGQVSEILSLSRPAALQLVEKFVRGGILKEITGKQRYRQYLFLDYIALIAAGTGTETDKKSQLIDK